MARKSKKSSKSSRTTTSSAEVSSTRSEGDTPNSEAASSFWSTSRIDAFVVLVYAVLSLAIACIPSYPHIFPEGKAPRLAGPDAYFHLRHTEAVLQHYPVIQRHDMLTNFPHGEVGLNQSFFDVGMATIANLTGLAPVVVLAWISPLLIVAGGIWCYFWLSRNTSQLCGALFLLFYLLYPGPLVVFAALGQGDHHAAEVFLAVAVAWSLDRLLRPQTSWRWAPVAMLPLFFFYLSWAGTSLHLLLVGAVFYVRAWQPIESSEAKPLALKGCLYGLTLLVAVIITAKIWPWSVIWQTSKLIFLFSSTCLAVGYPILVALARRPWRRPWLAAVLLPLVPFLLALALPTMRALLLTLFEERTGQISEHIPISLSVLFLWYGLIWLIVPWALYKLYKEKALWSALVPLVYGGGLIFFWLQTRDFNYYPPPILAAAAAYALVGASRRGLAGLTSRWGQVAILALLVVPPFIPGPTFQRPWMTSKMFGEVMMQSDGLEEAARWLKTTQGDIRPDSPEAFGVVTPWDLGNIIAQASGVPVKWSQTVSPELARLMFSDQPDQVYQQLNSGSHPLRYIVLPARNLSDKFLGELIATDIPMMDMLENGETVQYESTQVALFKPSARNLAAFIVRLYWGLAQGLGHFRLVFESDSEAIHTVKLNPESSNLEFVSFAVDADNRKIFQPLLDNPKTPLKTSRGILVNSKLAPEVRIFEAVPGARLTGSAQPSSHVVARINLVAHSGTLRPVTYSTLADSDGRYELRLPYPTDQPMSPAEGTIEVRGAYHVTVDGQTIEVQVSEADIQAGREVKL
jgi:asparagine N-glycosylation enzyme membrane subunit Stt3